MCIKSFILPVIAIFSLIALSGCQQNVREDAAIQQTKPASSVVATYGNWVVHEAVLKGKVLSMAITAQVEGNNKLGVVCLEDFPPCSPYFMDGNECELNASYRILVSTHADEEPKPVETRCSKIIGVPVLYLPNEYIGMFTRKSAFAITSVPPGGAKTPKDLIYSVFSLKGSSRAIKKVKKLTGALPK